MITIEFMGEGFTINEQAAFHRAVDAHIKGFLSVRPISDYTDFFQFKRTEVYSLETTRTPGSSRIIIDTSRVISFSRGADYTIVLVNSEEQFGTSYGRANIAVIPAFGPNPAHSISHELTGHLIARLEDEYVVRDCTYSTYREDHRAPNLSIKGLEEMAATQSKWYRWIGAKGVGAFPGGDGCAKGVNRAVDKTLMGAWVDTFGPVNEGLVVQALYRHVSPIVSSSRDGDVLSVAVAKRGLVVQWYEGGQLVHYGPTYTQKGAPVRAVVTDSTAYVRADDPNMSDYREWEVVGGKGGGGASIGLIVGLICLMGVLKKWTVRP